LPPRAVIAFGLAVSAETCWRMSHFTLQSSYFQIVVPQVLQGLGMACVFIPLATVSLSTIDKRQMSQATGLQNLVRQTGGSFGVAVFASLLGRYIHQARVGLVSHRVVAHPAVTCRGA